MVPFPPFGAYGELGQVTLSVKLEGFQPRLTGD